MCEMYCYPFLSYSPLTVVAPSTFTFSVTVRESFSEGPRRLTWQKGTTVLEVHSSTCLYSFRPMFTVVGTPQSASSPGVVTRGDGRGRGGTEWVTGEFSFEESFKIEPWLDRNGQPCKPKVRAGTKVYNTYKRLSFPFPSVLTLLN